MRKFARAGALALLALLVGGCAGGALTGGLLVGGLAGGGLIVAQERSIGAAIDDNALRVRLNGRLLDGFPDLYAGIAMEVLEGRVLVAGSVPSAQDGIGVLRLIWSADGVREVLNELRVAPSGGVLDFAHDSVITARVRTRLLADADVVSINYTVETVDGVVYMLGIAQDDTELRRAAEHAAQVGGVRRVVSHVLTRQDPQRKRALRASVRARSHASEARWPL